MIILFEMQYLVFPHGGVINLKISPPWLFLTWSVRFHWPQGLLSAHQPRHVVWVNLFLYFYFLKLFYYLLNHRHVERVLPHLQPAGENDINWQRLQVKRVCEQLWKWVDTFKSLMSFFVSAILLDCGLRHLFKVKYLQFLEYSHHRFELFCLLVIYLMNNSKNFNETCRN